MSSDERPEKGKQPVITRSKQSRRKLLKSMAAGGGAVVAGKSLSDQWAKPMVDSVLLPVHAQTSVCTVGGTMTPYAPQDNQIGGPVPIPGSYTYYEIPSDVNLTQTIPMISVNPGITDAFNLSTVFSDDVTDSSGVNQNLTPDPANGAIAFQPIYVTDSFGDERVHTTTLTPENSALCGGSQVITITFSRLMNP